MNETTKQREPKDQNSLKQQSNYNRNSNYNRKRRRERYQSPYETFATSAITLTILLMVLLLFFKFPVYLAYITGLNIVTFCFYGYDKLQAKREGGRIPEKILHSLAILGGAPGGIAGQWILHHKIRKRNFHVILWASLFVHLIIFVAFYQTLLTSTYQDLLLFGKSLIDNLNKTFNRR